MIFSGVGHNLIAKNPGQLMTGMRWYVCVG